jgi:hypothetical protein
VIRPDEESDLFKSQSKNLVLRSAIAVTGAAAALALSAGQSGAAVTALTVQPTGVGTGCSTPVTATVNKGGQVRFYDNGTQATFTNPTINVLGNGLQTAATTWKPATVGKHVIKAVQGNDKWEQTVTVSTGVDLGSACVALPAF